MTESGWQGPYTMERVNALHELTKSLDYSFAIAEREWWESRTITQLQVSRSGAWQCNDPDTYMRASCYLAARGALPEGCA